MVIGVASAKFGGSSCHNNTCQQEAADELLKTAQKKENFLNVAKEGHIEELRQVSHYFGT